MFFFFKSKKIHLDCFTNRPEVHKFYPIVNGSQCYPDWWKKLPNGKFDFDRFGPVNTMKQCAGFTDFFKKSVCMRLWSDLAISVEHKHNDIHYSYHYSTPDNQIITFPREQYDGFLDENYVHLNIKTPWLFNCKKDIDWIVVGDIWSQNLNNDLTIAPGSLNFKYLPTTSIQAFLKCSNGQKHNKFYGHGTPLMHLFPTTDGKVVIHNHLVSDEEYRRINDTMLPIAFSKKYPTMKKLLKEQENVSKCPFHRMRLP